MLDNPDPHPVSECEDLPGGPPASSPEYYPQCKTGDHFGGKLASGDLNGDGNADLVVGGFDSATKPWSRCEAHGYSSACPQAASIRCRR